MSLTPEFTNFEKEYKSGRNQVVYSKLTSDLDTPVSIMLKLAGAKKKFIYFRVCYRR
jgi:anthranilate synthase component 1